MHWDKELLRTLLCQGLDRKHAMYVIGIVAEQRQVADREGYKRGYENGYQHGKNGLTGESNNETSNTLPDR